MTFITPLIKDAPDSGLIAICVIAAWYQVSADPVHLKRELALDEAEAGPDEIVRAAKLVGFKARVLRGISLKRLLAAPRPAIGRRMDGRFVIVGSARDADKMRIIDPITHVSSDISAEEALDQLEPTLILVQRRLVGPGRAPNSVVFNLLWFLPSIWRYREPLAHVLLASLFVQLFALVTPLFFQVVIDKVLVHAAFRPSTCWSIGLDRHRPVRRVPAVAAHLRAVAHHQPHRRRTRASGSSPICLRLPCRLFRDAPGRPDGGARCANWRRSAPSSPARGSSLGARPLLHHHLHRGAVRSIRRSWR